MDLAGGEDNRDIEFEVAKVVKPIWDGCPLEMTTDKFREAQLVDEEWRAMHAWLTKREAIPVKGLADWAEAHQDDYVIEKGILMKVEIAKKLGVQTIRLLTVVPVALRRNLMAVYHGHPSVGGHMSGLKTYMRIKQHFWWPRVCSDVLDYVRGCIVCTMGQRRTGPAAPIQPHEEASYPFEYVAMDLLAMPVSNQGNKYACVIIDYFSRYAIVAPIPNKKATTIAKVVMERLVLVHGHPGKLLTDRGGEFDNEVLLELCHAVSTKKVFTTPYRPQSDGVAERFNRTLLKLLTSYAAGCQQEWDIILPYVLYAFNTSFTRATGNSPFSVIYGRDPVAPIYADVLDATGQVLRAVDTNKWKAKIKILLEEELPKKLREKAQRTKDDERKRANATKELPKPFKDGTVVVMINKAKLPKKDKRKLAKRQRGLYVVTGYITDVNVQVRKVAGDPEKLETLHVDLLQPVLGKRGKPLVVRITSKVETADDELDEDDGGTYEIEEVKGMRLKGGYLQFLVAWKDYDEESDEWMNEDKLRCSRLVEEFIATSGDELVRNV